MSDNVISHMGTTNIASPPTPTPRGLLWYHQIKREHQYLLSLVKTQERHTTNELGALKCQLDTATQQQESSSRALEQLREQNDRRISEEKQKGVEKDREIIRRVEGLEKEKERLGNGMQGLEGRVGEARMMGERVEQRISLLEERPMINTGEFDGLKRKVEVLEGDVTKTIEARGSVSRQDNLNGHIAGSVNREDWVKRQQLETTAMGQRGSALYGQHQGQGFSTSTRKKVPHSGMVSSTMSKTKKACVNRRGESEDDLYTATPLKSSTLRGDNQAKGNLVTPSNPSRYRPNKQYSSIKQRRSNPHIQSSTKHQSPVRQNMGSVNNIDNKISTHFRSSSKHRPAEDQAAQSNAQTEKISHATNTVDAQHQSRVEGIVAAGDREEHSVTEEEYFSGEERIKLARKRRLERQTLLKR